MQGDSHPRSRWRSLARRCCSLGPRTDSSESGEAAPTLSQPIGATQTSRIASGKASKPALPRRVSWCPNDAFVPGPVVAEVHVAPSWKEAGPRDTPHVSLLLAKRGASVAPTTVGSITAWQLIVAEMQRDGVLLSCSTNRTSASQTGQQARGSGSSAAAAGAWSSQRSSSSEAGADPADDGTALALTASALASTQFAQAYEVLGRLGSGAFGVALKASSRASGTLVCVKVLQSAGMSKQDRRMARREVEVLSSLGHPNVVSYHECFQERGQQFIVMEFCEGGDLSQYLKARQGAPLSEDEVMLKFVQLLLALHHVHSKGIIHRDIKTSNLFLTKQGILKLGDFGVSKRVTVEHACARSVAGTPYYFSPELVQGKPYNAKTDVWAAGCVLYELCTLVRPFKGSSVSAIVVHILRGDYQPISEQYSPELRQLVACLLSRKQERRPSISEVLGFEYVRRHMRRYKVHIQECVDVRRPSYQATLDPFQLDRASLGEEHQSRLLSRRASDAAPAAPAPFASPAAELLAAAAARRRTTGDAGALSLAASSVSGQRSGSIVMEFGSPGPASARGSGSGSGSSRASSSGPASELPAGRAAGKGHKGRLAGAAQLAALLTGGAADATVRPQQAGRSRRPSPLQQNSYAAAAGGATAGGGGAVEAAAGAGAASAAARQPGRNRRPPGHPPHHLVGSAPLCLDDGSCGDGQAGRQQPRPSELVRQMPQLLEQMQALMSAPAALCHGGAGQAAIVTAGAGGSGAAHARRRQPQESRREAFAECFEELYGAYLRAQELLAGQQRHSSSESADTPG